MPIKPTILHVEDDVMLAEVVENTFKGFGFRGTTLHAETVAEAGVLLDDAARQGGSIDLIITDMSLPDGSGLDVVRQTRRNPVWEHTPLLVLSGDSDPKKVGRAYVLGANCYVAKSPPGRSPREVVRSLYDHWLRDVRLPAAAQIDRTSLFLASAVQLRGRHAAFYMRMAEQFGDTPSEAAFWLTRALSESNLANLMTFLQHQFDGHGLPSDFLDEIEQAQTDAINALDHIENEIERHPITNRDEAYRRMLELVSIFQVEPYVRSLSFLFPVQPVATAALVDFLALNLDELASWIDTHATHPALRRGAAKLHANATYLRMVPRA